jgi:hypothetical protein
VSPSSDFSKNVTQSTLDSFDTELFITETQQQPAIWDSRLLSYNNKQENTYAWETLCKKFTEKPFFLFINYLVQQGNRTNFLLSSPLHLLTQCVGEGQQRTIAPLVETAVVRDSSAAKNHSWKRSLIGYCTSQPYPTWHCP